jgi:hypothetical protein
VHIEGSETISVMAAIRLPTNRFERWRNRRLT